MSEVLLIPSLNDNYIYCLPFESQALVVDPAEAAPVLKTLKKKNLTLSHILNTHHHFDHVAGNVDVKASTSCQIIGPDDSRIPGIDQAVGETDSVCIGPFTFNVLSCPGHTSTHIAFHEKAHKILFCGDTLFSGGCGRLFEGSPEQMYASLQKLASLPDDTQVFCGHEYTQKNLEFALSIEHENERLKTRLHEVYALRQDDQPTLPSTIGLEKLCNPFLRVHETSLRKSLKMEHVGAVEFFAHLRQLRDRF